MPDRAAPPVESPATELEVTPEMIEAGVMAYYENASEGWDSPGGKDLERAIRSIYRAMSSCSIYRER